MEKIYKQDNEVMRLLKVSTIQRVVCNTDKGYLSLQLRKGDNTYHLVLDAVPLEKEVNDELMALLFPKKEVVIPQVNRNVGINEKNELIDKVFEPKSNGNGKTKKSSGINSRK